MNFPARLKKQLMSSFILYGIFIGLTACQIAVDYKVPHAMGDLPSTSPSPAPLGPSSKALIHPDNDVETIAIDGSGKRIMAGKFGNMGNMILHRARLNTDGSLDSTFQMDPKFNDTVQARAVQSDGKILLAGTLMMAGAVNPWRYRLTRINSDGTLDTTFNIATFNTSVTAIALQSDGKILVAGFFTTFNGGPQNRIIRLNIDGTRDASFNIGSGFDSYVWNMALQNDGKILVAGSFTNYAGTAQKGLSRLNSDGSLDGTFNIATGFGGMSGGAIFIVAQQSDGKIMVGGNYASFNGSEPCITRLNANGSLDATFNTGNKFGASVTSFVFQGGKILVGGSFSVINSATYNFLVRLNNDGTKDNTFDIGATDGVFNVNAGFNNDVNSLSIQSDGRIIVGGLFSKLNGTAQNYIVRLNSDGTKDSSFDIKGGFSSGVTDAYVLNDGKIFVIGGFETFDGTSQTRIARLNADNTLDITFNTGSGFNNVVYATAIQSDGKILIGGDFTSYNGVSQNRLTRINADGSIDNGFATNLGAGFNQAISILAIQSDGKILAAGGFTTFNGAPKKYILRLNNDGTVDGSFAAPAINSGIYSIALQSDGKIFVGGDFDSSSGMGSDCLGRLNSDGSPDLAFNNNVGSGGFNSSVLAMALQADGKIVAGGDFDAYNGAGPNYIVRFNSDGTQDLSFNQGVGFDGDIYTLGIQSDGKIIAGGDFASFNGVAQNFITKINTDGTLNATFGSNIGVGPNGEILNLKIQSDDKIFIGGRFTTYDTALQHHVGVLNSDGTMDTNF